MGLAHEKKSYLQEKANLFEIGSYGKFVQSGNQQIKELKNGKKDYKWKIDFIKNY